MALKEADATGRYSIPTADAGSGTHKPLFCESVDFSGERYAGALTSSGMLSTGEGARPQVFERPSEQRPVARVRFSPQIRSAFEACVEATCRASESNGDVIQKANALNDLRDALARLWDQRGEREEQFGDLVGHLQGLLAGVKPEELPVPEIEAIRRVVRGAATCLVLTDADLRDLEEILIKAGCDVFREVG